MFSMKYQEENILLDKKNNLRTNRSIKDKQFKEKFVILSVLFLCCTINEMSVCESIIFSLRRLIKFEQ